MKTFIASAIMSLAGFSASANSPTEVLFCENEFLADAGVTILMVSLNDSATNPTLKAKITSHRHNVGDSGEVIVKKVLSTGSGPKAVSTYSSQDGNVTFDIEPLEEPQPSGLDYHIQGHFKAHSGQIIPFAHFAACRIK